MEDQRVAGAWLGDGDVAELSNEYELVSELGRGGSAVVYRALDRALGRDVAIKVVHPRAAAPGDDPVARLAREARTVAQLQHPNIVTVFSVRRLRSGGLALVMQMVPGSTLKQVIQREGPLPPDRVERIVREVAQALSYAHARGVVHRDVKPENIFVEDESGRVLLADFGIARSDEHDSMTLTGTALGTPFYMSPEQVEGGTLDGRSDLYSLGLVAWEMLTGRRPWDGESLYNVIYKQKHEELPPIEALRPGAPLRLQYLVERMLQKRPAARWAGADGLLAQIGHAVLPSDYGRWQTALRRRVEHYRETQRARVTEEPPASASAAATVRFQRRPRSTSEAGEPAAVVAVLASAATTAIAVGAGAGPLPSVVPAWVPEVSQPIDAPAPLEESEPVRYDDVAEPTWAAAGPVGTLARRPVLLAAGGLLAVAAVGGAAVAGRGLLSGSGGTARSLAVATPSAPDAAPGATPAPPISDTTTASGAAATTGSGTAAAPTFPIGRSADVLAAGGAHACVVTFGAAVYCWGANGSGQLGDATDASRPRPVRVAGDLSYTQLSAGLAHTCAVTVDGDAYCWGSDARGQLGDGTNVRRTAPVRVAGSERFVFVAAGGTHSCGLTRRAEIACWGANDRGQLGDGSSRAQRTTPGSVRIGDGVVVSVIVAGAAHACALDDAGRAFCWGANDAGQLGDGSRTDRGIPTTVGGTFRYRRLAAGAQHSCGITTENQVACWGRNQDLELGTREVRGRSLTPVLVPLPAQFVPVMVTAGTAHSCALGTTGDAWCWGRNATGQLGAGTRTERSSATQPRVGQPLAALAAAGAHTCALTTAGQPLCWGANRDGQIGDGTRTPRSRAAPVLLAPQVVSLPLRTR